MQTTIDNLYQIFKHSTGIETDTRKIKSGSLFFCLKGENFNANKFAHEALEKGALAVVIDEEKYYEDERYILVDHCLKTLQKLANYHRRQFQIPVIGITGTNGKTTTKELITTVLSTTFKVHATAGNFNNHIGVPLTLLSMPPDTEIAVIEMGANHLGEIHDLCLIAEPNYGLITNIGKAHLEGFGSLQGVINTKTELYNFILKNGKQLFVDADNKLLMELSSKHSCISYGTSNADYEATMISSKPFIALKYKELTLNTNLLGNYNFTNIMAALAVGSFFSVPQNKLMKALGSYQPANKRSQLLETANNKIYLDAYNANPTSMRNALESFASIDIPNKIAILGDMLELGEDSFKEHQEVITLLENYNFEEVILVGPEFMRAGQNSTFKIFPDTSEANNYLTEDIRTKSFILLKGSRGIGLENLLKNL